MHSERSYIENATLESMNFAPRGSRSDQLTTVGPTWSVSHTTTAAQNVQAIEINVHELRTAASFTDPVESEAKISEKAERLPGDLERGREYSQ